MSTGAKRLRVGLILVSFFITIPVWAQEKVLATYKKGTVTFTQGGTEVKWVLAQGRLYEMEGVPATNMELMFSPDGKIGERNMVLHLARMGDIIEIVVFAVRSGPQGRSTYRSRLGKCIFEFTQFDAKGAKGTGTCSGRFEGALIDKVAFNAQP